jgi:hypothetical protein
VQQFRDGQSKQQLSHGASRPGDVKPSTGQDRRFEVVFAVGQHQVNRAVWLGNHDVLASKNIIVVDLPAAISHHKSPAMGARLCCCGDPRDAEERLPLKLKPGGVQGRALVSESFLASHPAPGDLLDPAFEQIIDDINLNHNNDPQNRDNKKFEQFLQTVESVQ